MNNVQKYYLPEPTPWPIFGCSALMMMAVGAAAWVNRAAAGPWLLSVGVVLLLIMLIGWFGTVIRENNAGLLNRQVDASFRWAMAWRLGRRQDRFPRAASLRWSRGGSRPSIRSSC